MAVGSKRRYNYYFFNLELRRDLSDNLSSVGSIDSSLNLFRSNCFVRVCLFFSSGVFSEEAVTRDLKEETVVVEGMTLRTRRDMLAIKCLNNISDYDE